MVVVSDKYSWQRAIIVIQVETMQRSVRRQKGIYPDVLSMEASERPRK